MFVPANIEKFVAKATDRGADAILLDLEDSIAPAEKEAARAALPAAIEVVRKGTADVGVRVNRPLDLAVPDIEAAVRPGVSFLGLPKIENAAHVRLLAELVADLEARQGMPDGTVRFLVYIESAAAFFRMEEVAHAHPRVVALTLGSEDFASSGGFEPSAEALFMPKQMSLLAARAAGILSVGFLGTVANFTDLGTFREILRRSRRLGFTCGFAIHPAQVAVLNEEFMPSADEIAYARDLIAAADAAPNGAFSFRGKMVDRPIVIRAQALVDRARRLGLEMA
jgi:citrate lyase subunit beta/citryl-CoA lyase